MSSKIEVFTRVKSRNIGKEEIQKILGGGIKMKPILEFSEKKHEYLAPILEISFFDINNDVLCMSSESNDNDYDAGGLFSNG